MPVRAVNLKLVVPRRPDNLDQARSLWSTHRAVNEATRHYEQVFLACRQFGYETRDGTVADDEVVERLLGLIAEARKRNGYQGADHIDEARSKLRQLYETIVPSVVGAPGNAQAVGGFVSPLLDPDSKGFTKIYAKLASLPNWIDGIGDGDDEVREAAHLWLQSPQGQDRLRATGAPTKWMKLAKAGDTTWPEEFLRDVKRLRKEVEGVPSLMKDLRTLGVMPLLPSFFASRINDNDGAVSTWDRLAMRLVVGHLLSWESWCIRSAKEHDARTKRLDDFKGQSITGEMVAKIEALRSYEAERVEQLDEDTDLEPAVVRTTGRTIRGWSDLREKWLKKSGGTEDILIAVLAEEQTRKRGGFGDPHLFRWLAKPANRFVWNDEKMDALSAFSRLRTMELIVERSRCLTSAPLGHIEVFS